MKKILKIYFVLSTLFIISINNIAYADINLTIRDGDNKIFEGTVTLRESGKIEVPDNTNSMREIDSQSALGVVYDADILSENFSISNLEYFSSFGSLYLKCIESAIAGEKCDNWQYAVNGSYPGIGIDQKIVSDGDSIYVFFGPQYKTRFTPDEISDQDTFTVFAEKYDYENNIWIPRTDVTIGITKDDPANPWTPIEIETKEADENGQALFGPIESGEYKTGIKEDYYFPTEILNITTSTGGGSSSSSKEETAVSSQNTESKTSSSGSEKKSDKKVFDIEKAVKFLISNQEKDGSFGAEIYTDWATLALASIKEKVSLSPILKLMKALNTSDGEEKMLTALQRKSMVLMSLGINPQNWNGKNYIKKIIQSFDGEQFGEKEQINDDIFALLVLKNAGWSHEDAMIRETIKYILRKQSTDGSFENNPDMTGAGMQALSSLNSEKREEINEALRKAEEYLFKKQNKDGGIGNPSSTAWALGGILATQKTITQNFEKSDKKIEDAKAYLAKKQKEDGGIEGESKEDRVWQTAYAVLALSEKSWDEVMQDFEKIEESAPTEKTENIEKKEIISALYLPKQQKTSNKKQASAVKPTTPDNIPTDVKKENQKINNFEENSLTANTINASENIPSPYLELIGKFLIFLLKGF